MLASRICDRSLVKIYKDLMITKRDLIDIRESIHNTLQSIKQSDVLIQEIETSRSRVLVCRLCGKYQSPAMPHRCALDALAFKCPHCQRRLANKESLQTHKQKDHPSCGDCKMMLSESQEQHQRYSCGEQRTVCEICQMQVRKADLNSHVKICFFRECHKCKKSIYKKAYPFHLQDCCKKGNRNMIVPCGKVSKKSHRPMVIPCCLVLEDDML